METWIIGAIAALCGGISASIAFAGFWMMLGGRMGRIERAADDSFRVAAEGENEIKDVRAGLQSLATEFSKYREYALEKYVTYHVLSQIEIRLVEAQSKGEKRLIDAMDRLASQFDKLLEKAVIAANRSHDHG
jgi:hypothetical protein